MFHLCKRVARNLTGNQRRTALAAGALLASSRTAVYNDLRSIFRPAAATQNGAITVENKGTSFSLYSSCAGRVNWRRLSAPKPSPMIKEQDFVAHWDE